MHESKDLKDAGLKGDRSEVEGAGTRRSMVSPTSMRSAGAVTLRPFKCR